MSDGVNNDHRQFIINSSSAAAVAVAGTAGTGQALLIVSGDADLLSLQSFKGIPVVSAAQTLEMIGSR